MEINKKNIEDFIERLYYEYCYGCMNPRTDDIVEEFFNENGLGPLPKRIVLIKDSGCEDAGYIAAIQREDDEHYFYYCGHLHMCSARKSIEAVIYDEEFLKKVSEMELL